MGQVQGEQNRNHCLLGVQHLGFYLNKRFTFQECAAGIC